MIEQLSPSIWTIEPEYHCDPLPPTAVSGSTASAGAGSASASNPTSTSFRATPCIDESKRRRETESMLATPPALLGPVSAPVAANGTSRVRLRPLADTDVRRVHDPHGARALTVRVPTHARG